MQGGDINRRRTEAKIKAFYFLYFSAAAALLPYLALFYENRGLTGSRIGILTSLPPLIALFAASLWSGLADATQSHRMLLVIAISGTVLSASGIFFGSSFLFIAAMVVSFALFNSPIIPLIDNTTMKVLHGEEHRYGKLRLWGAVGWGITAPLIGILVGRGGLAWPFYGFIIILSIGLLGILRLPVSGSGGTRSYWDGFGKLMRNRQWVLFLLIIFVSGTGSSMINNYLFLYMNRLNAGPVLMGLSLTVATVSELVVFSGSDRLLIRWGIRKMLILATLALIVRLLAYSFISVPWMVLPVQLLHGLTFSLLWVAGVAYANRAAPPGMETTAQGMFSGVAMGLAAAVGAFAGGLLYGAYGPLLMYRWSAIGILVLMILIGLIWSGLLYSGRGSK